MKRSYHVYVAATPDSSMVLHSSWDTFESAVDVVGNWLSNAPAGSRAKVTHAGCVVAGPYLQRVDQMQWSKPA